MIIPASQLLGVYQAMRQDKHTSEDRGVVMFVANGDVDSLCSYSILTRILGESDMTVSTIPVENYEEVQEYCKKLELDGVMDLKTVFMINCGATENVREMCLLSDEVRVIIIDSHRPIWHGHNRPGDLDIVIVDDDDPVPKDDVPTYIERDGEFAERRPGDDLESSSDGEEGESSEEGEGRERGVTEHGDTSGAGRGEGEQSRGRRRRAETNAEQLRHNYEVEVYYEQKAGYGKPSALLLYQLAETRQVEDNSHLWMAILGLTEQYILQRVDPTQYTRWRGYLEHQAANLNVEEQPEDNIEQYGNNRAKHRFTVLKTEDLRLAFLKHWTLCDSMLYNHHVATRFQTWREAGKKQVGYLLSKLNIRMEQHQAKYTSMHHAVEDRLREKLPQTVATFGLNWDLLKYEGFEMQYKNDVKLLATDHAMAISAILGKQRTADKNAKDIFHEAAYCLCPHNSKEGMNLLAEGIELAKDLAVDVVQQGGLALTRKQVQGQRGFWYLDLANINFASQQKFHHPSTLLKLAIFLRDANAQRMRSTAGLLVVGPPNKNDECYIVTVRDKHQAGTMQSNPFAVPLQEALNDCGARDHMRATFDSTVYQIPKDLVATFCEEMRAVISAYQRPQAQE